LKETSRRSFLSMTGCAMGALGLGAAGWVAIDSMNPAEDTLAQNITYAELKSILPGQRAFVAWRRMPVFIYRRTKQDISEVRSEDWRILRHPQSDESRVKQGYDEWLLVVGLCTYDGMFLFGNKPTDPQSYWYPGGWFCSRCLSAYDKSGRVRYGPATINLVVPPYKFISDDQVMIGAQPAISVFTVR
jgi:ubiquinol-cytochrome c reductase iron-sulfur subunit